MEKSVEKSRIFKFILFKASLAVAFLSVFLSALAQALHKNGKLNSFTFAQKTPAFCSIPSKYFPNTRAPIILFKRPPETCLIASFIIQAFPQTTD